MIILITFLGILMESIAMYLCVHLIYDVKFKWSGRLIFAMLLGWALTMAVNIYNLPATLTFLNYLVIFWYCKVTFRESMLTTALCVILETVLTICIQFICVILMALVRSFDPVTYDNLNNMPYMGGGEYIVGSLFTLVVCIWLLPKFHLGRLRRILAKKDRFIVGLILFMCFTVVPILLINKILYKLNLSYTFFIIAALLLLLFMIFKWNAAQSKSERVKNELEQLKNSQKDYDRLLTDVRLYQHELKNHLTSVYAAHYTHKTYEELVLAQEEQCARLIEENRYTDLLLLEDKVLTGFLYGKFQEAEERHIAVRYSVSAKLNASAVPTYQMIEMLGILLDNAFEAQEDAENRTVSFDVREQDERYVFSIANPFRYVPYEELAGYFQPGESKKGSGRGLGLYHLKCLCEEWHCEISCRNKEESGENTLVFRLLVPKAGKQADSK